MKGDRQASESPPAPSLGEEMKTVLLGLARSNPLPLRQERGMATALLLKALRQRSLASLADFKAGIVDVLRALGDQKHQDKKDLVQERWPTLDN